MAAKILSSGEYHPATKTLNELKKTASRGKTKSFIRWTAIAAKLSDSMKQRSFYGFSLFRKSQLLVRSKGTQTIFYTQLFNFRSIQARNEFPNQISELGR